MKPFIRARPWSTILIPVLIIGVLSTSGCIQTAAQRGNNVINTGYGTINRLHGITAQTGRAFEMEEFVEDIDELYYKSHESRLDGEIGYWVTRINRVLSLSWIN